MGPGPSGKLLAAVIMGGLLGMGGDPLLLPRKRRGRHVSTGNGKPAPPRKKRKVGSHNKRRSR